MALVACLAPRAVLDWLNDRPDESVLRWLFRVMLAVTAAVLVLDFVDLNDRATRAGGGVAAERTVRRRPDVSPDITERPVRNAARRRRAPPPAAAARCRSSRQR